MKIHPHLFFLIVSISCFSNAAFSSSEINKQSLTEPYSSNTKLEEIIVTARKREENLQDTPIAISVLTETQLTLQGVNALGDLIGGTISSLNINPFSNASSTLAISIRGNGTGDVAQSSRDANVAVYLDEIYLGRAQGLDFELAELERIEVLRGPQGTLFGRNATAGAISIVSKRPSGEFGIRQTLSVGSYDLRSSNTHIDFPKLGSLSTKLDYMYSKRDGWVDNTAPDEMDHNAFEKRGYRISADLEASDTLLLSYTYNDSHVENTHLYFQFFRDIIGLFGDEKNRENKTRLPVDPLDPTIVEQQLHSFSVNWELSEHISLLSLSSYRELDDRTRNNFGGSLYFNGILDVIDVEQEQFAQELRLLGNHDRFNWVAGLYYYDEKTTEGIRQFFSLDMGLITGTPITPISPPTNFDALVTGAPVELRQVETELESTAIYGQATYTPPILDDRLEITVGVRHTNEDKSGALTVGGFIPYSVPSGGQTDPSLTLNFNWQEQLSTYIKWSSAFRSGGVNSRSENLNEFEKEEVESIEIGLKMQAWDNRFRLNTAVFQTEYDGMFIDIFDPDDLTISDTINAANTVEVEGAELDLSVAPLQGLTLGLSYTYLDGDIPKQPNPLAGGVLETFVLTQTARHVGSLTIDYQFPRLSFGTLAAHVDVVSSSAYNHWPSGGIAHPDGYLLVNARLVLTDIALPEKYGKLSLAAWGKNLTDEQYVVSSFHFEGAATVHAFGEPRTAGLDIRFEY